MRLTEFVNRVGLRLESALADKPRDMAATHRRPGEVELTILATLEVLGECLGGEEAGALAARLPGELEKPLTEHSADAKHYSLGQFHRQVAEREHVSVEVAAAHASTVMGVVAEAVGDEGMRYVRPLLPEGLVEPPPVTKQA